jgi:hypothetical protein
MYVPVKSCILPPDLLVVLNLNRVETHNEEVLRFHFNNIQGQLLGLIAKKVLKFNFLYEILIVDCMKIMQQYA